MLVQLFRMHFFQLSDALQKSFKYPIIKSRSSGDCIGTTLTAYDDRPAGSASTLIFMYDYFGPSP